MACTCMHGCSTGTATPPWFLVCGLWFLGVGGSLALILWFLPQSTFKCKTQNKTENGFFLLRFGFQGLCVLWPWFVIDIDVSRLSLLRLGCGSKVLPILRGWLASSSYGCKG